MADDLAQWAAARGAAFFVRPDQALLASLAKVSAWAASQRYDAAAVNLFLSNADCFLVAHGLAHGHVVVTHERPSNSTKRIKRWIVASAGELAGGNLPGSVLSEDTDVMIRASRPTYSHRRYSKP